MMRFTNKPLFESATFKDGHRFIIGVQQGNIFGILKILPTADSYKITDDIKTATFKLQYSAAI